jgi:hypothetical protein
MDCLQYYDNCLLAFDTDIEHKMRAILFFIYLFLFSVSGVLYLIGVIVYGAKFDKDYIDPGSNNPTWGDFELGYCFGLSIVALILEIVAGVLIFLDSKKGGTSPSA